MEGPYRDLGAGFARLTGLEGTRRTPSRITYVEDALLELARNARDAGATRIFVASTLKARRYRTLTVIDDGHGIPQTHKDLILEPGVTTRHLNPTTEDDIPHGAGLSLYQIKARSLNLAVLSTSNPTSIQATFDTHALPERALQSTTRPSNSNLRATLHLFTTRTNSNRHSPNILSTYYGAPARILATLLHNRIIQTEPDGARMWEVAHSLGLVMSVRSVHRVLSGGVRAVEAVSGGRGAHGVDRRKIEREDDAGPVLELGEEEREGIADILRRAARAGYLEVEDLGFESRPGEVSIRASIYEPEEEYE